jgi:hypothetical protein
MKSSMNNINSASDLKEAILQLEGKRAEEGKLLREQFRLTYQSITPLSLIRSTIADLSESQDLKDNIVNTALGLGAGYLSKRLYQGRKSSPLKRLFGSILMFGVTNLVTKNPDIFKDLGDKALSMIRGYRD